MPRPQPPTASTRLPLPETAVIPRGVARASRQLEKALGEIGLTLPQYRVLGLLSRGDAGASKLAESLAVSAPSLTGLVDGLVTRGLVEREPDADDRRRVSHRLTEDGTLLLGLADEATAARLRAVLEHLPEGDRADATRGLALLTEAFERATERRSRPDGAPAGTPAGTERPRAESEHAG